MRTIGSAVGKCQTASGGAECCGSERYANCAGFLRGNSRRAGVGSDGEACARHDAGEAERDILAIFERDTFCRAVLPTAMLPRFKLFDEKVTGATPLPLRATVCVPVSSAIARLPLADPGAVGVNVTETVQEAPAARVPRHVLVSANGAAVVTVCTCIGPVPVFCRVTLRGELVVFCTCGEKPRLVGLTLAAGAVPTPASGMACVAPRFPESSVTIREPAAAPVAEGAKVTLTMQAAPARSWLEQVFVSVNPPVADMVPMLSGLPPKFEMVTCCEPEVPAFCDMLRDAGRKLTADGCGFGSGMGVTPKT